VLVTTPQKDADRADTSPWREAVFPAADAARAAQAAPHCRVCTARCPACAPHASAHVHFCGKPSAQQAAAGDAMVVAWERARPCARATCAPKPVTKEAPRAPRQRSTRASAASPCAFDCSD